MKKTFETGLTTYIIGFVLSIALTFAAYFMVVDRDILPHLTLWTIALVIVFFAVVQFIVQLFFFLHLRVKAKPRWRFVVFFFMILVVIILAGGSLWIMGSLNSRMMMMTPDQINQYMNDQVGL